jgi:hypothetical protein
VTVTGSLDGRGDLGFAVECVSQLVLRDFEAAHDPVVAHA